MRMSFRNRISATWIFVGIALVAALLAFFLSTRYLDQQESRIRTELAGSGDQKTAIVVASKNLFPGDVIAPETMAMGSVPSAHLSLRMIRPEQFKLVEGRALSRPLRSGEPLMIDYIAGSYVERFSELLAAGERAVSLEVTELENHAGMLVPGDHVDLFVITEVKAGGDEQGGKQSRLTPVLERVKVLAAGPAPLRASDQEYSMLDERERSYSALTVGVPVEDAERLLLAREMGTIAYLLRRPNDEALSVTVAMDSSVVLGGLTRGPSASVQYRYISAATMAGKVVDVQSLGASAVPSLVSRPLPPKSEPSVFDGARAAVRSEAAVLVDALYPDPSGPSQPAPSAPSDSKAENAAEPRDGGSRDSTDHAGGTDP